MAVIGGPRRGGRMTGVREKVVYAWSPLVRGSEPLRRLNGRLVYLSVEMSPLGMCKMKTKLKAAPGNAGPRAPSPGRGLIRGWVPRVGE